MYRWMVLVPAMLAILAIAALAAACEAQELPAGAIARLGSTQFRHNNAVRAVAISNDGKWIASGSWDRTARSWDATGREVARIKHPDIVLACAFSPDAATVASSDSKGTVILWEAQTGREIRRTMLRDPIELQFSSDGKRLGVVAGTRVTILDAADLTERIQLATEKDPLKPAAFSRDLKWAITGGADNSISIWDLDKNSLHKVMTGHAGWLTAAAISPDGRFAASSSGRERLLRIWDIKEGKCLHALPMKDQRAAMRLAFMKNGDWLAWAGEDGNLRIHDTRTAKPVEEFPIALRQHAWALSLAVSSDGHTLVTGSTDKLIRLWDFTTGKAARTDLAHADAISSIAFVDGGEKLVTSAEDGMVICWDAATGKRLQLINDRALMGPHVAADARGARLAICSEQPSLTLLSAAPLKPLLDFNDRLLPMHNIVLSADGHLAAVAQRHDIVRIIELSKNQERSRFTLNPRQYAPIPLAFSPDGRFIASGSGDPDKKFILIFDTATGEEKSRLDVQAGEPGGGAHAIAWSADGAMIAVSSLRRPIELWEVATARLRARLEGDGDAGACIALSPDGRYLAAGGGPDKPTLRLWDLRDGKLAAKFTGGHQGWLTMVAFSPDSRRVVSASQDTTAIVWDVAAASAPPPALAAKLDERALDEIWQDMGGVDAALAWRAMQKACAAPGRAVPFLAAKVSAAPALDERRVAALIARLDAERFSEREKAQNELAELGEAAAPRLRTALDSAEDNETRTRLGLLLKRLESPGENADTLRGWRAVEWFEQAASPEALKALETIRSARAGTSIGDRAASALQRSAARTSTPPK